jgi:hypothetical protein
MSCDNVLPGARASVTTGDSLYAIKRKPVQPYNSHIHDALLTPELKEAATFVAKQLWSRTDRKQTRIAFEKYVTYCIAQEKINASVSDSHSVREEEQLEDCFGDGNDSRLSFDTAVSDPRSMASTPNPTDGATVRGQLEEAAHVYYNSDIRPYFPTLSWPLSWNDAASLAQHDRAKYLALRKKLTKINEHAWSELQPRLADNVTLHNKFVVVFDGKVADTVYDAAISASCALDELLKVADWHPQLPLIRQVAGTSRPGTTLCCFSSFSVASSAPRLLDADPRPRARIEMEVPRIPPTDLHPELDSASLPISVLVDPGAWGPSGVALLTKDLDAVLIDDCGQLFIGGSLGGGVSTSSGYVRMKCKTGEGLRLLAQELPDSSPEAHVLTMSGIIAAGATLSIVANQAPVLQCISDAPPSPDVIAAYPAIDDDDMAGANAQACMVTV